ncbi:hypothetical protein H1C71_040137 [Ictidomys tridecemlineatus]|nr:hypothetical protein H1C71_040137 [Ictidomys tridecemlineatus]
MERTQLEAPALRGLPSDGSFADLGLEPGLLRALHDAAREVFRPTTVQSRTRPQLLHSHHLLCAAETGSGKTLSYLLPLLQRFFDRPALETHRISAPRGLVLLPSRKLAEQVQAVAQSLGRSLGLRIQELGGGHGMRRIRLQLSKQPSAHIC